MSLKLERVRKNLTQGELREISKVSLFTVGKLERNGLNNAKLETLIKLAKALDIPVEQLLKED